MAVTTPLYMDGVLYDGATERRGLSGLLAQSSAGTPRSGVLGPAPEVQPPIVGNPVKVGPFNAAISAGKGAYLLAVDAVTSAEGNVGVADSTNPRLDRLVLEVLDPDSASGGTLRKGRLRLMPGMPAAIPALPALPATALHIAQVLVPKSTNGAAVTPIMTVDPQFTAASGAPVPVRTEAERDALGLAGVREVVRLDNGGRDFILGSKWVSGVAGLLGSAGWNVSGVVESVPIGGSAVRQMLTLKLGRSAPDFNVGNSSGFVVLTGAILPVDQRPTDAVDIPASYVSSAKSWGGNAVLRVSPGGTISILPTAPTTSINLSQGGYFTVSTSWIK